MRFLKKLLVACFAAVMVLTVLVFDASAQRWRSGWRGDNGNHYGWYKGRKRWKNRRYRRVYYRRPAVWVPRYVYGARYYYDPYLRTYRTNYPRSVFSLNIYR